MTGPGLRPSPHRYSPSGPRARAVSARLGLGLEELKAELEDAVLRATGRRALTLRVQLAGPQLRCAWWACGWGGWGCLWPRVHAACQTAVF